MALALFSFTLRTAPSFPEGIACLEDVTDEWPEPNVIAR